MNKLFKKVLSLTVVTVMALSLTACGSKETSTADKEAASTDKKVSSAMDKDTIILGFDDTFAPMGFKDEKGEVIGFDIDLAKEVASKLEKDIEFKTINWDMKETELNAGNIDFIWNGYSISDERKEKVAFGTPYLKNKQIIVTLADSDINTKADLKDKAVAAQKGSTAVDAVENEPEVLETFKDSKLVTYDTNDQVLRELEAGRCDAAVADEILVKYYMIKKGEEKFKVLDEDFGEEEYGVGMRKDDTKLVEAFNKAYAELKEEGKVAEISTTWFGEDITK